METHCPPLETVLRSHADPGLRDELLVHAAGCPGCLRLLETVEDGLDVPLPGSDRILGWRRRIGWVAAAVLVAIGGAVCLQATRSTAATAARVLPAGEEIALQPGDPLSSPERDRFVSLPDGSRLRIARGAHLLVDRPGRGDRARLNLNGGVVEAEVVPGHGAFRIRSPAGEIAVLGTHFWANSFRVNDVACLCVEVYDGKVLLQGGARGLPISGGERGVAVRGQDPEKQALGGNRKILLGLFSGSLRLDASGGWEIQPAQKEEALILGALIRGGRWEEPAGLEEAPADPERLKEAKRMLREGL